MHQTAVREVPGSILASDKDFYVCFFVCCSYVFTFLVQKEIKLFGVNFCNVNLFSILNLLQNGNSKFIFKKLKSSSVQPDHLIPVRVVSRTLEGRAQNAASQLLPGIHDNKYKN